MGSLDDSVIFITGGGGSIGLATAKACIAAGAAAFLVDRDPEALRRTVGALPASARFATHLADVSHAGEMERAFKAAADTFGALHGIVSNAGIVGPIATIADYDEAAFDEVLQVHVKGAFLACKLGLPLLEDGGSIVIVSSVAGLRGDPGPYGYITAKHAQIGLMRAVAKEAAGRAIRVNTIHPGPVDNEFQAGVENELTEIVGRDARTMFNELIPLGRHAQPQEIADAIVFLLGPHASFITGAIIPADGGMSS